MEGSGIDAFRWDATNGMVSPARIPGFNRGTTATDVSDDGSIIVGSSNSSHGIAAFIWTEETGLQDRRVVLTSLGLDLSVWGQTAALVVSADHRTIVGHGYHLDGEQEAWVAVIPEPTAALFLGLGRFVLGSRPPSRSFRFSRPA